MHQVCKIFDHKEVPYGRNVQELLENLAEKYPDKIAFKDKNNLVTYNELMIRAQSIGTFSFKKKSVQQTCYCIDRQKH